MSPKRMFLLSFLSFVLLFLGPGAISLSPIWSAEETKVADGGALEGKVVFRGTPPAPRKVIPTQDQQVCGSVRDEPRIVLGKDNTVRGAIVYLKGVEKGKPFEKPSKPPMIDNQQFKSSLKQPGLVDVRCDVHGHMQAWILVAENPYYAVTKEDGAFAIKDIPPGKYTLATFQPHTGTTETPVTVEAKKTNNVTVELKK